MEEQQLKIYILDHNEFNRIGGEKRSDFKNVPTPALTSVGRKQSEIKINYIIIDEDFLPDEKKDEYFRCLVKHELAEFDFYIENPEAYEMAVQKTKTGEEIDPAAHLYALKEELKFAKELGILDEYNKHWRNWMENQLKKIDNEKAKEATMERIKWREEAFNNIARELKIESKELKRPLR